MKDLNKTKLEEDNIVEPGEVIEEIPPSENDNLSNEENASDIDVTEEKDVEIAKLMERLLRSQAEFENFRRRTQKEKEEFYGIQHLLQNENSKVKAYGS